MNKKEISFLLLAAVFALTYAAFASAGAWTVAGTIQNSSFATAGQINVSIGTFAPPSAADWLNSTLTADDGSFHLTCSNDSSTTLFKIRVLARMNSSNTYGPTGNLSEIGPILPALPLFVMNSTMFNGSTIYTEPAATIEINATFSNGSRSDFNYMLMDDVFGDDLEMNVNSFITDAHHTIYVPRNRTYTLLVMKSPDALTAKGVTDFSVESPIPPIPFAINNISDYAAESYILRRTYNLSFTEQSVAGYVFIAGNNTEDRLINFTKAVVKLSSNGIIGPGSTVSFGTINITSKNTSVTNIDMPDGAIGYFSLPLLGASTGVGHTILLYGKNETFCDEAAGGNCYFGAIFNVTATTSNISMNVTLYPLVGSYDSTAGTKYKKFYAYDGDSTANPYLNDAMAEVKLKNSSRFGTLRFMVESISNSYFGIFMPSDVASAAVKIFSQKSAPMEKPAAINNSIVNFTIKGTNMEMPTPGGGRVAMDASHLTFRILRYNDSCNTPFANFDGCQIGNMQNGNFNPLSLLIGGKINLKIDVNGTDSSMLFIGVDKFGGAPPTNSVIGNESTSSNSTGDTLGDVWQVGTLAPDFYEKVYVTIPYNSSVDETHQINITLNTLYDNDWAATWSINDHPSATSIPSDYSDYNTTWFNQTKGGMPCTNSSTSSFDCYVNYSGNYVVLNLPHFSNAGAALNGKRHYSAGTTTYYSSGNAEEAVSALVIAERKANWYSIEPGQPKTMDITDEDFEVRKIEIAVKETAKEPKITVARLSSKPAELSDPPRTAYRYIQITEENLNESIIDEAKIEFRVEKSWLEDNTYGKDTVKLYRYKNNKWTGLPTERTDHSVDYFYYEATAPGFSYFAIAAGEPEAEEAAETEGAAPPGEEEAAATPAEGEVTGEAGEAEEKEAKKAWIWWAIGAVAAVGIICFILFAIKKRKK